MMTGPQRQEIKIVSTSSFKELVSGEAPALLRCQSSRDLSFIPDRTVDLVITDPPYLDNVQYSELADFFYVWLRLGLKNEYSCFGPELSAREDEILQNERLGKTARLFMSSLRDVFGECRRVLKDEGLLIFTFHHRRASAWQTLGEALTGAGFHVSACPIVRSEGKSGFHSSQGNVRYDAVFVCRKTLPSYVAERLQNLAEAIAQDSLHWARRTLASKTSLSMADLTTIVMAKSVEHFSRSYRPDRRAAETARLAQLLKDCEAQAAQIADQLNLSTIQPRRHGSQEPRQLDIFPTDANR